MDWTEAFLAGQKCSLAGVPKPKNCCRHRPRGPLWVDTLCQGPKSRCGSWPGHIEAFSCLFRWCFKSCFACSSFYSFHVTKPIHLTIVLAKWNLSRNEGENTHVSSHDLFVCLLSPEQTVAWLLTCFLSFLGNCIGIFSIGKTNPHWRSGTQIRVPNDDTSIQNGMKLSESNYNFIHKKTRLWDILKTCRALHSLYIISHSMRVLAPESPFLFLQLLGCYTYLWRDVRFSSPEIYILCSLYITPVSLLHPVHFFMLLSALSGCTASCSIMSRIAWGLGVVFTNPSPSSNTLTTSLNVLVRLSLFAHRRLKRMFSREIRLDNKKSQNGFWDTCIYSSYTKKNSDRVFSFESHRAVKNEKKCTAHAIVVSVAVAVHS